MTQPDCDVLIVGGGLSGMSAALALRAIGLDVIVIDPVPAEIQTAATHDGRTTAISQSSKRMLERLGVWDAMPVPPCPIGDIRVREGGSPLFLQFDRGDAGSDAMGFIVDNGPLKAGLYREAAGKERLRVVAPASVAALAASAGHVTATLKDGTELTARLTVAADGRPSPTRRRAGIRTTELSYGQTAITCTVRHSRPHDNIAFEHFRPAGPFAMLPLLDDEDGAHRSCLVWSERTATADALLSLSDAEFDLEMQEAFGDTLGTLHVSGKRWAYPLGLIHAERYIGPRLVLVGDAAHGIHPIAGQGFNLGLRDIAALTDTIEDAMRLGIDFGSAPVLEKYQRWRRFDVMSLIAATDGINRLFSNNSAPIKLLRDVGLGLVQRIGPLKRAFMRSAMGTTGNLPRLMQDPSRN
ncbi:UbiH/UbiF/VisC/COQ6 family ubiquinone biosynthesis hydroxylase [Nisaea acidiphila]|uniref:UbiH/UbiF/VisC/COQ6 family ubiquinone biosynthesis hydroxylase n=1 Tax=Nisaea acidiphila TaxID=1862145 RepID=A0A9J7AM06_9PROT|nr:UbiH/UbiF/VisC/COQ6 family ubiquinone biosynthesis hydroxylase [Nisaea acidiphila]UUX47994.1 UbiH/UbiF/VisC/COQ6 family ubiquinone biosynthesis hydroxylase [Nisaea acidiphila]